MYPVSKIQEDKNRSKSAQKKGGEGMKRLSVYQKKAIFWIIVSNALAILISVAYTLLIESLTDGGVTICAFKDLTRLYCPGCGGSRSVAHLLKFDFYSSFRSYPPMFVMLFFCVDIELRAIMSVIRDDKNTLTGFNLNWLILIPASILLHFGIRNILLLIFKIDYLGDILG